MFGVIWISIHKLCQLNIPFLSLLLGNLDNKPTLFSGSWITLITKSLNALLEKQKKYRQSKEDFEAFCRKIGWTTTDGEVERKKKWFGKGEFTYDVKKAPEGHLPLTSALRGTSLIKELLAHPVWDNDDWKKEP